MTWHYWENLEGRQETGEGELEPKGLRLYVKKTTMIVSTANIGKIREEIKFPCAVSRRGAETNSMIWQFCKYWVHKRCSGIKGKLKEDGEFRCQTYTNEQTVKAQDRTCLWLNGQSLEILEKFCYLDEATKGGCSWQFFNMDQESRLPNHLSKRWCQSEEKGPYLNKIY